MARGPEPDGIEVRAAAPYDAPVLAALHAACFDTGESDGGESHGGEGAWNEAAMAQFIAGPGTVCLIAVAADGAPAGFVIARAAADEAEILSIGVLPDRRQCGTGRALLCEAMAALRSAGVRQLFLEVDEGNGPALALYRGLGARSVGRRPGYYENGADAAVLSLDLRS